jgi:hypothetical protein
MSIELKIKSKHLALEPSIIRTEERKLKKQIDWYKTKYQITGDLFSFYREHPDLAKLFSKHGSLVSHRRMDVRFESRATYLARAYIKGVPYKVVESNTKEKLDPAVMGSLIRMVMKYGKKVYNHDLDRTAVPFKVVKKAEDKAKEDIVKWLEQE